MADLPPLAICFSRTCYYVKFDHSTSNRRSVYSYGDLPENFDPSRPAFPSHSRSLLATRISRLHTHDFLLVFRGNYSPISYRFRDKGRYLQIFPTPLYFISLLSLEMRRQCGKLKQEFCGRAVLGKTHSHTINASCQLVPSRY